MISSNCCTIQELQKSLREALTGQEAAAKERDAALEEVSFEFTFSLFFSVLFLLLVTIILWK